MKKLLLVPACFIGITITLKAQDEPPPPPPPPKVIMTKFNPPTSELQAFYKRNPDVARLFWRSEKDVVVVHKDKSQFTYNMKNNQDKDAFETKYGTTDLTPPPPPPPPKPVKKTQKLPEPKIEKDSHQ